MSKKRIAIFGYGPGISHAVASRFGREGFEVALVARTESRLSQAVASLKEAGIEAHAFPADLSDPAATRKLVTTMKKEMGPLTVLLWNALSSTAGDLLEADVLALQRDINVGLTSFIAALQPAVEQMKGQEGAAVLITGGGFAFYDDAVDQMIAGFNVLPLAAVKAGQHKLASTLSKKLEPLGIYVGEVLVTGLVKGTSFDGGQAELEPAQVAEAFWKLYSAKEQVSVTCP